MQEKQQARKEWLAPKQTGRIAAIHSIQPINPDSAFFWLSGRRMEMLARLQFLRTCFYPFQPPLTANQDPGPGPDMRGKIEPRFSQLQPDRHMLAEDRST